MDDSLHEQLLGSGGEEEESSPHSSQGHLSSSDSSNGTTTSTMGSSISGSAVGGKNTPHHPTSSPAAAYGSPSTSQTIPSSSSTPPSNYQHQSPSPPPHATHTPTSGIPPASNPNKNSLLNSMMDGLSASYYALPNFVSQPSANQSTTNTNPSINLDITDNPQVNIVISGLYVAVAIMMIIQGFGIMANGGWTQFFLGCYTMAFGVTAICFDLRVQLMGIDVESWFPFLGNYIGRSSTIFFFALLAEQSKFSTGWNSFIMTFDIIVALLYTALHFVSAGQIAAATAANGTNSNNNNNAGGNTSHYTPVQDEFTDL